jgi:hypothetical protein
MNYIKKFESFKQFSFYTNEWEKYLPAEIIIIKNGESRKFHRENVMLHADMVQIDYVANKNIFGQPDEFEIDLYFVNKNGNLKFTVDISYGDFLVSEFSIEPPNKVKVIEYTSYHSRFNPDENDTFAFEDDTIKDICNFLNHIDGVNISPNDLKFLDKRDNYNPDKKQ